MTYGYKDFVIFPFEYSKNDDLNANIEISVDFLICDDVCVPEKAFLKTSYKEIQVEPLLSDWNDMVPSVVLPVIAKIYEGFIDIRFSSNEVIDKVYFFIESQNVVNHANEQTLIKEENNGQFEITQKCQTYYSLIVNFLECPHNHFIQ